MQNACVLARRASMDSQRGFERPLEQGHLKPDFKQAETYRGGGQADDGRLHHAVAALKHHDAEQIQNHADVDAQAGRDQHEQKHRAEKSKDALALFPCQKRLGRVAPVMHEGHDQIDGAGGNDERADVERKIARLRAGVAPADAEFERSVADDAADQAGQQGDRRLHDEAGQ